MGNLIIIAGHPGSGKSYLVKNLYFLGTNYVVVKKKTTRPPRKNESLEMSVEFSFNCSLNEVKNCDYCYKYRDELYGFNFSDIDVIISKNLNAVIIIKLVNVIKEMQKKYKNSFAFLFISVLSTNSLKKYLLERSESSEDEIKRRLFSPDEEKIKRDYSNNISIFNKIIFNKYDEKFLEEIKHFLTNQ